MQHKIYINNWFTRLSREWSRRRVCMYLEPNTLLNFRYLSSVDWVHKCGEKQAPYSFADIERFVSIHVRECEAIYSLSQVFKMTCSFSAPLMSLRSNWSLTLLELLSWKSEVMKGLTFTYLISKFWKNFLWSSK